MGKSIPAGTLETFLDGQPISIEVGVIDDRVCFIWDDRILFVDPPQGIDGGGFCAYTRMSREMMNVIQYDSVMSGDNECLTDMIGVIGMTGEGDWCIVPEHLVELVKGDVDYIVPVEFDDSFSNADRMCVCAIKLYESQKVFNSSQGSC